MLFKFMAPLFMPYNECTFFIAYFVANKTYVVDLQNIKCDCCRKRLRGIKVERKKNFTSLLANYSHFVLTVKVLKKGNNFEKKKT